MDHKAKPVFAYTETPTGPIMIVGMTTASWEYCKDGKTLTFDLDSVGIPLKLVIFGAENHEKAIEVIQTHNAFQEKSMIDVRDQDLGIKKPSEH